MKESIARVIGKGALDATEVVKGLTAKGWMPNAKDPQQYISYVMSSSKEVFDRVERGRYKVKDGVTFGLKAKEPKPPEAKESKGLTEEGVLRTLTPTFEQCQPIAKRLHATTQAVTPLLEKLKAKGKIAVQTRNHAREWRAPNPFAAETN